MLNEKYKNFTIKILLCIPIFFSLVIIDKFLLPHKKINDNIESYSQIIISRSHKFSTKITKEFVGYKFYTAKDYEFSLSKTFVEENEITIEISYLFHYIISIRSNSNDYSDKLMTGLLNGAVFYILVGLTFSSIISLLYLKFNINLTENGFYNVILMNSFLIFIILYLNSSYN